MAKVGALGVGLYTLLVVALVIALLGPALSEPRGYEEIRAACSGDAYRLCAWGDLRAAYLGKYGPIKRCILIYRAQVSEPCRETLRQYGY